MRPLLAMRIGPRALLTRKTTPIPSQLLERLAKLSAGREEFEQAVEAEGLIGEDLIASGEVTAFFERLNQILAEKRIL